jgi:hypothetical protein
VNPRTCARRALGAALAAASFGLAAPAAALPVLSEVLYDASGSDDGSVFVEIFGLAGTSLDGLFLDGVNGSGGGVTVTVELTGAIPADGVFVVADATGGGTTFVAGADLVTEFDFQNGPDSVVLRSETSVLDALGYGAFDPGDVFAGEGAAAPDAPAGTSLARRFADVDSDDNAADFELLSAPTPGVAPVAPVPEPSLAWLLVSVWAAGARRRG